MAGINPIWAVGGDDAYIGVSEFTCGLGFDFVPIGVEMHLGIRQGGCVTMRSVVLRVALKEVDLVATIVQCAEEAAQECSVSVPPSGSDGQAEDDDFHSLRSRWDVNGL